MTTFILIGGGVLLGVAGLYIVVAGFYIVIEATIGKGFRR